MQLPALEENKHPTNIFEEQLEAVSGATDTYEAVMLLAQLLDGELNVSSVIANNRHWEGPHLGNSIENLVDYKKGKTKQTK